MTHPGVPTSPGFPALEGTAQQAIQMARSRLDVLTRAKFPLPVKTLSDEEKAEALKSAKDDACRFCSGLHAGASTAACPRLATFKLNGDHEVVEGSYWPEGVIDSAIEMNGAGEVVTVTFHEHRGYNTSRIVFIEEIAEGEPGEGEAASGLHRS